ncbi:MAG: metal ABC transporter ATP-binding protein [Anaerococcus vaginalis]|uniref:ABC transporter, ATP-binding protein n=2 Tax=Anaerococcus vaginalis TaxID=33037 RepID=C7HWI3_9FIRM|nr:MULTISPECIES: metal ABC transporter ATP-binding protein [Anaerococcus]EEU11940.1 ABC transporter, ATP-binding protein [Anaerococcus vaginalis ATCC 51170]MBS4889241.1 metal ABC transporter ATP-binding protein [Anaerococcus vaginalis]MBS6920698.1 metal ABC transporter ATP-binding protein [Anaerococcus vaginalis]MDU0944785.1 metal ABC transporter ATP-binding protein [Anaerococcus vaginalis]MDU1029790.1 metal ABC transporter ATP-binding protein [Anaerococcus vaginalis]
MKAVSINNLNFSYSQIPVLKNCNLNVDVGEFTVILGGNGSGKSTLIKLMLGELKNNSGEIKILGKNIEDYVSFKDIGYVPQINIVNKIAFPITCLELVSLNLYEEFGLIKIPKKNHYQKAKDILKKMGMENYINTPVNELSGGLAQRAMISKAMINDPKILILDEPTAGVDKYSKDHFFETIDFLSKKFNVTIIMVTHELKEMESLNIKMTKYEMIEGSLKKC